MGYYPLTLSACYSRATEREHANAQKGVPIPGTHKRNRRKYVNGAGVSANSRVLSHHYADEGEKGPTLRREIRRKERAQWLSDWAAEVQAEIDEMASYDSWE